MNLSWDGVVGGLMPYLHHLPSQLKNITGTKSNFGDCFVKVSVHESTKITSQNTNHILGLKILKDFMDFIILHNLLTLLKPTVEILSKAKYYSSS